MKKQWAFAVVLLFLLTACGSNEKYNRSQQRFVSLFDSYTVSENNSDAHGKQVALRRFNYRLRHLNDTVPFFVNWRGKVKNMEIVDEKIEGGSYPVLHFEIEMNSGRKSMNRLGIWKVLDEDRNKDPIYSQLKDIGMDSTVWFDGTFWKERGQLMYWLDYRDTIHNQQYPMFRFVLFRVSPESHGDSLSPNLQQILAYHDGLRIAYQKYYNQVLTDDEWSAYKEAYTKNVVHQRTLLNPEERDWNRLYLGYILSDDARFYLDGKEKP